MGLKKEVLPSEVRKEWATERWLEMQRRAYLRGLITYRDYDICVCLHYRAKGVVLR